MVGIKGKSGIYKRKPFIEERLKHMSESQKGHPWYHNANTTKKMKDASPHRKISEEHKLLLSKLYKGIPLTKERKLKISKALTGKKLSKEHIDKLRVSHTGEIQTKERIINQQNSRRKNGWFKNLEKTKEKMRLKRVEIMKTGGAQRNTKPELIVKKFFDENDVIYIQQWKYKYGIADFYLPKFNTIIEVDGNYWHSKPEVMIRDKLHTEYLIRNGYAVIRISDKELTTDRLDDMIKIIKGD